MAIIKSLDYVSTGVTSAIIEAILGLIFGIFVVVVGSAIVALLGTLIPSSDASMISGFGILIIIVAVIGFAIAGFIGGIIFALLYNLIFSRWVKLSGNGSPQLASLDYLSAAVVFAVTYAAIYFVFSLLGFLSGNIATAIVGVVVSVIGGLIVGFIIGLVFAILYNLITSRFAKISVQV